MDQKSRFLYGFKILERIALLLEDFKSEEIEDFMKGTEEFMGPLLSMKSAHAAAARDQIAQFRAFHALVKSREQSNASVHLAVEICERQEPEKHGFLSKMVDEFLRARPWDDPKETG
jgi:uncharacterized pyridoxal phosphate-containing UPF0001 family protein